MDGTKKKLSAFNLKVYTTLALLWLVVYIYNCVVHHSDVYYHFFSSLVQMIAKDYRRPRSLHCLVSSWDCHSVLITKCVNFSFLQREGCQSFSLRMVEHALNIETVAMAWCVCGKWGCHWNFYVPLCCVFFFLYGKDAQNCFDASEIFGKH